MMPQADRDDEPVILEVPPEQSGARLLEFVSLRLITESKAALRRLIASGDIRLNGSAVGTTRTVWTGDAVSLPLGLRPAPPPRGDLPIDAIFEDEDYACIDKPAGWPVLPARGGRRDAFYRSLLAWLNRAAPAGGPYVRPHVVHRLDRETSGVLLVAKHVRASRALGRQFMARSVRKAYLAVVEGVPDRSLRTIDVPIGRLPGSHLRMMVDPHDGRDACTEVEPIERFGHFSLLEVRPRSGRQHQIRVHLAAVGHPLAVDALYGHRTGLTGADLNALLGTQVAAPQDVLLDRSPLHAVRIACRHPRTRDPVEHEAPLSADMRRLLDLLRRSDPPGPVQPLHPGAARW
jgi:23S rRNA pseudouridine1911/1915/1917 synthase